MIHHLKRIINKIINWLTTLGQFFIFFIKIITTFIFDGVNNKFLYQQIEHLGIKSLAICTITGAFSGAVMAVQSYKGFQQFGGDHLIGVVVALTLTRELGPVLTGLMVAGRAGAGISSEIGTMKVTEQIDALTTMNVNPIRYIVIPRVLATTIVVPCLTLFSIICGILGGYLVSINVLGINGHQFVQSIRNFLSFYDIFGGLVKAFFFELIISWVATYKGYSCSGGAQGVGQATTETVVVSSISIIIVNYFLALLIFGP